MLSISKRIMRRITMRKVRYRGSIYLSKKIYICVILKNTLASSLRDYLFVTVYLIDKERPIGIKPVRAFFIYKKFFKNFLLPPEHQPTAIWQIQRKGERQMPLSCHNGGGGEPVWRSLLIMMN